MHDTIGIFGDKRMENCKLLLFDLDGTLLRSDKIISQTTLKALQKCREKDILIGVSTSRGEQNALGITTRYIDCKRRSLGKISWRIYIQS